MGRPKGSKNKKSAKNTTKKLVDKNALYINDLPKVMKEVKELLVEREMNPGGHQDGNVGPVLLEGEPHILIENDYVSYDEARVILQTRKVVEE